MLPFCAPTAVGRVGKLVTPLKKPTSHKLFTIGEKSSTRKA